MQANTPFNQRLASITVTLLICATPALTRAEGCTSAKPCIMKAVSAKVRYYDSEINEIDVVKKRAFNKTIPAEGLKITERVEKDGITMLVIQRPDNNQQAWVEETAFEIFPKNEIDCTGIANAIIGEQHESTSGVSVGLGNPCANN